MRIGINALFLLPGKVGGSETYIRNLVEWLPRVDRSNTYIVFINKESVGIFERLSPGVEVVLCSFQASHRPVRILWEQLILPFQLLRHKIDILLSAGMTSPFFCTAISVLVIFDLQHMNQPQNYSPLYLIFLKSIIYLSAKTADGIVTISEKVKDDIIKFYRIVPDKIAVTYLAVDHEIFYPREKKEVETIRTKYGLPEKFILYAASFLPHKNHIRLFEAMKIIKKEGFELGLVLIGAQVNGDEMISAKIKEMGLQRDIVCTGWLPFEDVPLIYCAAEIFIFPSLHEGFGIPVLEAMACGIPVVCSNIEPIKEVAGDAAFLVDPHSPADIAMGMSAVVLDKQMQAALVEKGLKRAADFTWENTAQKSLSFVSSLQAHKKHY